MYEPPHFVETRAEILHGLIRAHPLGLLISAGPDGPVADPVPFLLDADVAPAGRLRAHVARANPHWRLLAETPDAPVLVVFQGPDAYVSPSWYETKRETGKVVPTWNYAMVQVRGIATIRDESGWIGTQIGDLTQAHEGTRDHPWAVTDAPPAYIEAQKRGIVGIEIRITGISGKWKVSQNRPAADQAGVVDGLGASGDDLNAAAMAGLVAAFGSSGGG
jgi:transcriptional regulator